MSVSVLSCDRNARVNLNDPENKGGDTPQVREWAPQTEVRTREEGCSK